MALLSGLTVLTIGAGTVVLAIVEGVEARGVAIDLVGAVAAVGAIALRPGARAATVGGEPPSAR